MFSETTTAILDKSDFLERFSNFVERYETFRNVTQNYAHINSWIKDKNYVYIMSYLSPSPTDNSVPFTLTDFVKMDHLQMEFWHDYCLELKHLLDEKDLLYRTLNRYYNV